jgi:thiamine biosynthesis lipoprotein
MPSHRDSSRREFLTGRAAIREAGRARDALAERLVGDLAEAPQGGNTVRVATTAMACDFAVLLNPGPVERTMAAADVLDVVHALEDQMTVYREHSELSAINRRAAAGPVPVEPDLFQLLQRACRISHETGGAFDPTSGPLIALWRRCRRESRIPTPAEIDECRQRVGADHVHFDEAAATVCYDRPGVELNLGAIGKGYALDVAAGHLAAAGFDEFLIHGGHSSLLARGGHNGLDGWPVGVRNPLLPDRPVATVVLREGALGSSGSGEQFFRHGGKRYGHIIDPRTGWPSDGLLSVTVLAPTAAEADALSTAFFVLGLESARRYCDNHPDIRALLIPPPRRGNALDPLACNFPAETLYLNSDATT